MKLIFNKHTSLFLVAAAIFSCAPILSAQAANGVPSLPESVQQAPDVTNQQSGESLQVPGQLSPQQQEAIRLQVRKEWENLSPEEQDVIRKKWQQQWQNLTPEQRVEHREKYEQFVNSMTPEQKKAYSDQMLETINNLTPQEKEMVKRQLIERYKTLSPEDQKIWQENFQKLEQLTDQPQQ